MRKHSLKIAALIGTLVLIPVLVALALFYVQGEKFDIERAMVVVAAILAALVALLALEMKWTNRHSVLVVLW